MEYTLAISNLDWTFHYLVFRSFVKRHAMNVLLIGIKCLFFVPKVTWSLFIVK